MKEVREKKRELAKIVANIYAGKEKNLKKARRIRFEIARMLTKLNMKGKKS